MKHYFIQSNDGRFVVLDVYSRNYRLVKDAAKRGEYSTLEHAQAALEDASKYLLKRNGALALAIFEAQPDTIKWSEVL